MAALSAAAAAAAVWDVDSPRTVRTNGANVNRLDADRVKQRENN